MQKPCIAAADRNGRKEPGGLEAGGENDDIRVAFDSVRGDDAAGRDPGNGVGDQRDIAAVEGWIPLAGDQPAFAAKGVVRSQSTPGLGVLYLFQVPGAGLAGL